MQVINLNGQWLEASAPVFLSSNRAYRYGDGLFETIRMVNNHLPLAAYHFERLLAGLGTLEMDIPASFTPHQLTTEIISLCEKNSCSSSARVRLSVSRGNGGHTDPDGAVQYLIECSPAEPPGIELSREGLEIGIYPMARKQIDAFSHLKSSSALPYRMAARFAKTNGLGDALVLNSAGRIADGSIANIFLVKDQQLLTPALSEGCVAGVMRRYVMEKARGGGMNVTETAVTIDQLREADEIFLTNAIYGIHAVSRFENVSFPHRQTVDIYRQWIATIF